MGRPGGDSLLCPEIFGEFEQVPTQLRAAVADRLKEVMAARGGILHACGAFNALYFNYCPRLRRYTVEPDPDAFITAPVGGPLSVLPVGAYVRLTRGTRELWGEVAAVLGAREDVDRDGWAAGALSGAPAVDGLDRQRVIVDTEVFGPLSQSELVERGRWLRPGGGWQDGHLVGPVPSACRDVSARDQAGSFAAHLAGPARPLLDLGPLPGWLWEENGEVTEADIARAVRAAISCLGQIMASTPGLHVWGLYGRSAAESDAFAASAPAEEVLSAVSRPAPGGHARYTALWPLLDSVVRSIDRPEQLTGVSAAALVVDANLALANAVTHRMSPAGIDVRLDDRWQQGGIWRAQPLPVDSLLAGLDPLSPAGVGYAESEAAPKELRSATTAKASAPADDTSRVCVVHMDDELVVLTVALSASDLAAGRLKLGRSVLALLPQGPLILQLHHDGAVLPDTVAKQQVGRAGASVSRVAWPQGLLPGTRLTVAAARAGRRLTATTIRLQAPEEIEGYGTVLWEYEPAMLVGATGSVVPPAPDREADRQASLRPSWRPAVAALEHLIIEALKRDGENGPADSRRLDGVKLTAALFGSDIRSPALLWTVIHTCEDMALLGLLTQSPAPQDGPDVFTWWPSTPEALHARSASGWDAPDSPTGQPLSRRWIRPQRRRLPDGQRPSLESRRDYARWRIEVEGTEAETELPPGMTFVHGHLKGSGPGKPWHRHVARREER
ncbi:hypothetical protein [Streptomyces microflavus]|uniref:hypothetical protein n=1 Tax=Streptomyces microflavus TaxID=1919 RepID=UPI002E31D487|nr:hypothetical protein [Streptomyces microflavus]